MTSDEGLMEQRMETLLRLIFTGDSRLGGRITKIEQRLDALEGLRQATRV